jgi:O-antigen ligase
VFNESLTWKLWLRTTIPNNLSWRGALLQKYAQGLTSRSFSQWIERAGVTGLFVFAFGMLFKKDVANAGILLMALSFGLSLKHLDQQVIRDRLLLLSMGFFLFLVLRTFFAALEFPEQTSLLVAAALRLFGAGFFLAYVVAFWMHRARERWDLILIVIMFGFLVQVLRQMDWGNLSEVMQLYWTGDQRPTFGFATNRFGLFCAFLFLACVLLPQQVWGSAAARIAYSSRIVFWGVMCCFTVWGVIFSQSRSAWVASVLVIPLAVVVKFYRANRLNWKKIGLVGVFSSLVLMTIAYSNLAEKRLALLDYEGGVSIRLRLYQIGWEKLKEAPWVGHGPGTSRILIQATGEKIGPEKGVDHFHNVLIDIFAQVGIIGVAFYVSSFFLIIRQARFIMPTGAAGEDYRLFAISGIVLILLTGVPNQPLTSPHGVYLIGYLGGICYSSKFTTPHSNRPVP